MGSLDIKSEQKVLESELEITSNQSDSMVDSPTTSDRNYLLELVSEPTSASDSEVNELIVHSATDFNEEKASCSSSMSSGDFMLEDPFQDSDIEHGEKTNTRADHAIESPPIQMMKRPSPTTEKYRIPSSVFARKESVNSGWGMPSNESLFSIQMGDMSFRNQDSIVWRSGDLDLDFAIEPSPSGKPMEVGTIPELDETGISSDSDGSEINFELEEAGKAHEFGEEGRSHKLGEEDKIQSLSEISNNHGSVITDDPVNPNLQGDQGSKSVVEELNSHFAGECVGSRSSFAFPILTADKDKGPSARITSISKMEKSEPQLETQPHSEPYSEPGKQTQPSGPKADPPATTWINCFGCCTFCS